VHPGTRRLVRLTAALATAHLQARLLPGHAVRRRQRAVVCGAARVLAALGARVHVVQPPVPWPRTGGRLRHDGGAGRLADLAVLTAVPRQTAGWSDVADRAFPRRSRLPGGPAGRVDCPVVVRYRTQAGPLLRPPRGPAEALAIRGLVVEVHLLAPVPAVTGLAPAA
jgi:hypothetical protein